MENRIASTEIHLQGMDSQAPPLIGGRCPKCGSKHWPKEGAAQCMERHARTLRTLGHGLTSCYRCGKIKADEEFKDHRKDGMKFRSFDKSPRTCEGCYVNWDKRREKDKVRTNGNAPQT